MLNILVVISGLNNGGTESFLFEYYRHIAKRIANITILSYSDDDPAVCSKFIDIGCEIIKICPPVLKNHKIFKKDFINIFRNKTFDIIHCNCNLDNALFLKYSKKYVKRRICHFHDTLTNIKFSFISKIKNNYKRKTCLRFSTAIFGCSLQAIKDMSGSDSGVVIDNIVNYEDINNIDSNYLESLYKKYNIDKKMFVVGNISRFEEKKNQIFILKLFKELLNKKPHSILILGGTGDDSKYKQIAQELSIIDNIRFIGPRTDTKYWYKIINLYLMPSLYEGFGISAVEAQYSNCYVIASTNLPPTTDVGGIKYIDLDNFDEWILALLSDNKCNVNFVNNDEKILYFINKLIGNDYVQKN